MANFTTEDLIAEIQEYLSEDRDPGGVTVGEFAEAQETSRQTASAQLNNLLGTKLERRKFRVDGRRCWVYYKK